jgi:hypothetical protein
VGVIAGTKRARVAAVLKIILGLIIMRSIIGMLTNPHQGNAVPLYPAFVGEPELRDLRG